MNGWAWRYGIESGQYRSWEMQYAERIELMSRIIQNTRVSQLAVL